MSLGTILIEALTEAVEGEKQKQLLKLRRKLRKVGFLKISDESPINTWFELSYAHYLTVPRSVLEQMPVEWQTRFAKCLTELDATLDWRPKSGRYWVRLKDDLGKFVSDPLENYRHPVKVSKLK